MSDELKESKFPPLKVLVVDDSRVDTKLMAMLIEKHGGSVTTAKHGEEALELIARDRPDVIFTDLQMPNMNGLELIERVKVDYPDIPIVLVTAQGSEAIAVEALRAGAVSYIPKRDLKTGLAQTLNHIAGLRFVLPSVEDLMKLPAEFLLFLAMRSARRVIPLCSLAMAATVGEIRDRIAALELVVRRAEDAFKGQLAAEDVKTAKAMVTHLLDRDPVTAALKEVFVTVLDAATVAQFGNASATAALTRSVLDWSEKAAEQVPDAGESLRYAQTADMRRLREVVAASEKIAESEFGPLWPLGPPDNWPASTIESGDAELLIELEIPDGVAEEDIVAIVKELAMRADDVHRISGGDGLVVDRIEIHDSVMAPEVAPHG